MATAKSRISLLVPLSGKEPCASHRVGLFLDGITRLSGLGQRLDRLHSFGQGMPPMARRQSPPPPESLADAVRLLSSQVEALTGLTDTLSQRVQLLVSAIDDIREELAWAVRNDKLAGDRGVVHITSMPKDPLAADFGGRINRYTAADLLADSGKSIEEPGDQPRPSCQDKAPRQRGLWDHGA